MFPIITLSTAVKLLVRAILDHLSELLKVYFWSNESILLFIPSVHFIPIHYTANTMLRVVLWPTQMSDNAFFAFPLLCTHLLAIIAQQV